MSLVARDYLEHALTPLETNALDRQTVDWRQVRIHAYDIADDARESADTYPAIHSAVAAIGNPHNSCFPPVLVAAPPAPADIKVPAGNH